MLVQLDISVMLWRWNVVNAAGIPSACGETSCRWTKAWCSTKRVCYCFLLWNRQHWRAGRSPLAPVCKSSAFLQTCMIHLFSFRHVLNHFLARFCDVFLGSKYGSNFGLHLGLQVTSLLDRVHDEMDIIASKYDILQLGTNTDSYIAVSNTSEKEVKCDLSLQSVESISFSMDFLDIRTSACDQQSLLSCSINECMWSTIFTVLFHKWMHVINNLCFLVP